MNLFMFRGVRGQFALFSSSSTLSCNHAFSSLARHNTAKKAKEREKKQQETTGAKRSLNNVRVIQRNLVYVTNLSLNIAKEEVRGPRHITSIVSR